MHMCLCVSLWVCEKSALWCKMCAKSFKNYTLFDKNLLWWWETLTVHSSSIPELSKSTKDQWWMNSKLFHIMSGLDALQLFNLITLLLHDEVSEACMQRLIKHECIPYIWSTMTFWSLNKCSCCLDLIITEGVGSCQVKNLANQSTIG